MYTLLFPLSTNTLHPSDSLIGPDRDRQQRIPCAARVRKLLLSLTLLGQDVTFMLSKVCKSAYQQSQLPLSDPNYLSAIQITYQQSRLPISNPKASATWDEVPSWVHTVTVATTVSWLVCPGHTCATSTQTFMVRYK